MSEGKCPECHCREAADVAGSDEVRCINCKRVFPAIPPSTDLETTPGSETVGGVEPCPFCGKALHVAGGCNPYATCRTDGCWMASRQIAIPLDDPNQVGPWNQRTLTAPDDAGLVEALKTVDGDWKWLCNQLERWPTRVHPDRTTNMTYLHESAAKIIRAALTPGNQS